MINAEFRTCSCEDVSVGRRAIWVATVGAAFVLGAGLTVGPTNEDSGRAVTMASGSAITALVDAQLSDPPGGFFTIYGIERPTPDDLEDLGLPTIADAAVNDPEHADAVGNSEAAVKDSSARPSGLEALVGVPTLSFSSGDLTTYTIPSGSEISAESSLCAAVGLIVHIHSQITAEVGGSMDPGLTVGCARNRVSIVDSSQRRSPPSISTADWHLLWSAIRTRQPSRFIVQDVKGRRTLTLAQGASAVLGPFADEDARALYAIDLHDRGWDELTPPSVVGFVGCLKGRADSGGIPVGRRC
jgi:hypothetical protein